MRRLIIWIAALSAGLALAGASTAQTPPAAAEAVLKPYAFLYRPGPAWKDGVVMSRQGLSPHTSYISGLHKQGRIYAAGSLGAERGLAIVGAASLEEARAMLAADPAVATGIFLADVEPFGQRFRGEAPIPLAAN